MILWQFVGLLAVHWVADFVLQTHWQASNKSKRLDALAKHVTTYTFVLAAVARFLPTGGKNAQDARLDDCVPIHL